MTERECRVGGTDGTRDRVARTIAEDLDALGVVTSRDLPPSAAILTPTINARDRTGPAHPGGFFMNALHQTRLRPWLTAALSTVVVALALLFVPISYDRLIGSELTLRLGGAEIAPGAIREIASELRARLGAEKIRVEADPAHGTSLIAEIPNASWREVARLALEYTRGLADRGIPAVPRVRPRFEKAHGNVYAAIGNLVEIRIQTEGKSDSEIAAEIRDQLLAAGMSDATVEVSRQDGQTQLRVEIQKTADGQEGEGEDCCPEFRITLDGQEPGDPQTETCQVRVRRTEEMTDQDVIDEVQRQLHEQGVNDAEVYIESGKIRIRRPGQ